MRQMFHWKAISFIFIIISEHRLAKTHRAKPQQAQKGWIRATLKKTVLIFLLRTVSSEAILCSVACKEWHGGKINHCLDPWIARTFRPPHSPGMWTVWPSESCKSSSVGTWESSKERFKGSGWPLYSINSSHQQSGSSLTVPPPPTLFYSLSILALLFSVKPNSRRFQ